MKKRIFILTSAVLALTGCGMSAQYTSSESRFQDGIYYSSRSESVAAKTVQPETGNDSQEIDALIAKTKQSEIYLLDNGGTQTIAIPENKAATISFSGSGISSVTISDTPDFSFNFSLYPWTYYTPFTFPASVWDPWYYGRYWGYYDPWDWNPWYTHYGYYSWNRYWRDPWYYGWYWGDPYWYHHHHYWHHHHHHDYWAWSGSSSGRTVYYGSRNSLGVSGSSGRTTSRTSSVSRSVSRTASRTTAVSRSGASYSNRSVSSYSPDRSSSYNSSAPSRRPANTSTTYRPSTNTSRNSYNPSYGGAGRSSSSTYNSSSSSSRRSSYTPSYSNPGRSSSSYSRSSSSSGRSSSYSGGSSRSSSYSGSRSRR